MGICVLRPAHESGMRGLPCLCTDLLIPPILFKFSHSIYILVGFFETFLEGSVDRVIYRDCMVNRRFFTCCSLATARKLALEAGVKHDRA